MEGLPTLSLNFGHATTPKSSPSAFWMPGMAHNPHHCMAASPWVNEDGSHQSVGAPSSSEFDVNSSRIFLNDCSTSGVMNPGWLSSVR